jgi:hypothetical protein
MKSACFPHTIPGEPIADRTDELPEKERERHYPTPFLDHKKDKEKGL